MLAVISLGYSGPYAILFCSLCYTILFSVYMYKNKKPHILTKPNEIRYIVKYI